MLDSVKIVFLQFGLVMTCELWLGENVKEKFMSIVVLRK